MKKLWEKDSTPSSQKVESFTVGRDPEFDLLLASHDVLGSIAHAKMLGEVGLLKTAEVSALVDELKKILSEIEAGQFQIEAGVEDVHSQVEFLLTKRLGEVGKKIHMARSRNDQVLLDTKLFLRDEVERLVLSVQCFFELLQTKSEQHKKDLLPGYTHLQLAMPSSFGLWFGAYAESLVDDLRTLHAAYEIIDKNPLGSGAGFGSSFPINRKKTTELLGFSDLAYNVVYAQMGRGKSERVLAQALSNFAETLSRLSMDMCLFLNQNFGFVKFPDALTTGSSIMPHKKNPDVFELIRSKCNRMKALPNEVFLMTSNLPSGYHRDLQILKEHVFPAVSELIVCIEMASLMLQSVEVTPNLLVDKKYEYLFSVEEVNRLVLEGKPFRDAYREVGESIAKGTYQASPNTLHHSHEGSIGCLNNEDSKRLFNEVLLRFQFSRKQKALQALKS